MEGGMEEWRNKGTEGWRDGRMEGWMNAERDHLMSIYIFMILLIRFKHGRL